MPEHTQAALATPEGRAGPARSPSLAELFVEHARRQPEAVAIRSEGASTTYGELDAWSDAIARALAAAGAGAGDLVGIGLRRSPAVLATIVALRKLGAPYVAVDPDVPLRRNLQIARDASPHYLLVEPGLDRVPPLPGAATVEVPRRPREPVEPVEPAGEEDRDLFQVVYTSGTTGAPKGVLVSVGSVRNRLEWMWRDYPFGERAVLGIQKSHALVAAFWELLGGLLQGIPSVLLTREEVLDPALFFDAILAERVTHLYLTPALIEGLVDEQERRGELLPLRLVTNGADTIRPALARRFRAAFPDTKLLNLYGLTECSSNVAAFDVERLPPDATRVPVGRPVAGASIEVVDRAGRIAPVGVAGEIHVAGPPVAAGYLDDPELTSSRFVERPDGRVAVRTGDLGRWLPSGDLELVGRLDNQVKVRGYRVELEEIEAVLATAPGVAAAAVAAEAADDGDTVLLAYVEAEREAGVHDLKAFLRERLPEFMVPAVVQRIAALPRGASGKVDRGALAALRETSTAPTAPLAERRELTPTQARVAQVWKELLGAEPADLDQDFFDAGGHSILAVRLVGRLREVFDRELSLRAVFEGATVRRIAAALEQLPDPA
jgi:amino acid adenylation domain-containing protein